VNDSDLAVTFCGGDFGSGLFEDVHELIASFLGVLFGFFGSKAYLPC
jgi:hypothetical protein